MSYSIDTNPIAFEVVFIIVLTRKQTQKRKQKRDTENELYNVNSNLVTVNMVFDKKKKKHWKYYNKDLC